MRSCPTLIRDPQRIFRVTPPIGPSIRGDRSLGLGRDSARRARGRAPDDRFGRGSGALHQRAFRLGDVDRARSAQGLGGCCRAECVAGGSRDRDRGLRRDSDARGTHGLRAFRQGIAPGLAQPRRLLLIRPGEHAQTALALQRRRLPSDRSHGRVRCACARPSLRRAAPTLLDEPTSASQSPARVSPHKSDPLYKRQCSPDAQRHEPEARGESGAKPIVSSVCRRIVSAHCLQGRSSASSRRRSRNRTPGSTTSFPKRKRLFRFPTSSPRQ